ncbi:response regulator [Devosia sp.]|jgi:DNA-binding NarL/FixJ family response regulator|uniref:response regulator n=1 Tax=Devosia sp. TaxID=1871048 RepID=UPI0037C0812B
MRRLRVAFVDDHPILLEGMISLFNRSGRFEVVASGDKADAARQIAESHQPELMIMDLSMPGDVFGCIAEIVQRHSDIKIIVFTAFASVDSALRALDAGASGFVLKGSVASELFGAVEAVMNGDLYITHDYASQVLAGLRNKAKRDRQAQAMRLSVREKQIVGHLLQARTNREIAETLSLSEKTVKHYMTTLMSKLHARNRVEVVLAAQKAGQLD